MVWCGWFGLVWYGVVGLVWCGVGVMMVMARARARVCVCVCVCVSRSEGLDEKNVFAGVCSCGTSVRVCKWIKRKESADCG